jgi:hypothetical protein
MFWIVKAAANEECVIDSIWKFYAKASADAHVKTLRSEPAKWIHESIRMEEYDDAWEPGPYDIDFRIIDQPNCHLPPPKNKNQINSQKDIVWDAITDSAKHRFNYSKFQKTFAVSGNDNLAENILFMTIAGHASGKSTTDIAANINQQFLLIGYSFPDIELNQFISERKTDLLREIEATEIAIAFFQMGLKPSDILVQVRCLLIKP